MEGVHGNLICSTHRIGLLEICQYQGSKSQNDGVERCSGKVVLAAMPKLGQEWRYEKEIWLFVAMI